jgi:Kef-type K+ transport system membrane component KefB
VAVINDTQSRGPVTATVLGVTVIKDVLVVLLFAVMLSFARASLRGDGSAMGLDLVERLWWEVGGSIVMGAVLGWVVSLYLDRWKAEPILFVLGIAVVAAWLADHLHPLTTGLFVENVASVRAEPFVRAVESNSIPFYALFFFLAGAGIHLDALAEVWVLVLLLVVVRAAAIWSGRTFPAWGEQMAMVFVAMVAVHELVGPVLFQRGLEAAGETAAAEEGTWEEDRRDPTETALEPVG